MTVATVTDLSARLRRVTLTADRFVDFARSGADECFGLLVPGGDRTHLRWYTVRAHRPERGEIDVDFVLHDHRGPAVDWARAARPGAVATFRQSGSAYLGQAAPRGAQLLLADETALPALSAIVATTPPGSTSIRALVELPDDSYAEPVEPAADDPVAGIARLHRGDDPPGSRLLAAARQHGPVAGDGLGYAWVCGESAAVKAVRRHLVDAGMDRRRITFSGYWRH